MRYTENIFFGQFAEVGACFSQQEINRKLARILLEVITEKFPLHSGCHFILVVNSKKIR